MPWMSDYKMVAKAIAYLGSEFRKQPGLDELAERLGVSRYQVQRIFTRWAGVSPKRFLQFLTLEHAKECLAASETVLRTAYESGLSGPSRLHDLFVSVEAMTPGDYKRGGAGIAIRWGIHPTPFGAALLGGTDRGLCHLSFLPDPPGPEFGSPGEVAPEGETGPREAEEILRAAWPRGDLVHDPQSTLPLAEAIFALSPVERTQGSLSVLLKGTNFQIKVWNALLRIPPGSLTTYGRVAEALGSPGAARAVGSAVGKNPLGFLIPCHRVIRSAGGFGDYRWGGVRKRAILGWEAARHRGS